MPRLYSIIIIFLPKIKSKVMLWNNPADTIIVACSMCMWVCVDVAVDWGYFCSICFLRLGLMLLCMYATLQPIHEELVTLPPFEIIRLSGSLCLKLVATPRTIGPLSPLQCYAGKYFITIETINSIQSFYCCGLWWRKMFIYDSLVSWWAVNH